MTRPLHVGTARHLGRVLLYLVPMAGAAIVLAVWLAMHVGLLADARAVAPSSSPWLASVVLGVTVWAVAAIGAWALQGVR